MTRAASIHGTLLAWLAGGLAIVLLAATALTYHRARSEANILFDLQLQQTAASIIGMPIAGSAPFPGSAAADGLIVQIWDRAGVRVYVSQPQAGDTAKVPSHSTPGYATIDTPQGPYRIFSVVANGQLVQVGQPLAARNDLAARLALSTIVPLALAMPVIAFLVWLALRRGLAPLNRVAQAVQKRAPGQLSPLAARGWPREIQPVVDALNGLLDRLGRAIDTQRAFVADAAHELRSPLAALALQAQLAERAQTPEGRASALADLRGGLARATRMVEQLLALAREEPGDAASPLLPVDLIATVRETCAALAPLAAAKSIDLGVTGAGPLRVEGDRHALATLAANLVDNAIRYTQPGGRVDAAVEGTGDAVVLAVRDNGPGIPPSQRARALERFARGNEDAPGSGLGLAIVARIVERHGATLALGEGLDEKGLGVSVRFPAPAAR